MCSAGGKTCFEVIPNFEPSKILFLVWNITFFASLQQSFFLGTHRSREFFFCFFEKVTKKYHFRPIHVGSIKCSLLCFSFTLVYKIERTFWIDQPYFVKDEICVCVREREGGRRVVLLPPSIVFVAFVRDATTIPALCSLSRICSGSCLRLLEIGDLLLN